MIENTPFPESAPFMMRDERTGRNKTILLEALKAAGAARATITYSGGGDDGFVREIGAMRADGSKIALTATVSMLAETSQFVAGQWRKYSVQEELPLDQALSDFAMEAVHHRHGGWQNGESAYGEVVFECESATARIEHNAYFVESEFTETAL